jgi:protein-tyrosine phosphatase
VSASREPALSVCFVCLGNICRSPTAEAVMRHLVREAGLESQIAVASAGTGTWHLDEPPDSRARAAAHGRGIRMEGRARQFSIDDFDRFDYIVSMDARVLTALKGLARSDDERARVHNFRSFDSLSPSDAPVPDPYYGGPDGFEDVLDICEAGCRGLLDRLRAQLNEQDGAKAR